jgi:hypothetical protein
MSKTKEQRQLMEWRRDKARVLHVERSLVSKDMTYIRQEAQEHNAGVTSSHNYLSRTVKRYSITQRISIQMLKKV